MACDKLLELVVMRPAGMLPSFCIAHALLTLLHPPCPHTPQDICYDVPRPKSSTGAKQNDSEVGEDTLRLLRHVSGAFRPGVLTALMGASGAGKTVRNAGGGGWFEGARIGGS